MERSERLNATLPRLKWNLTFHFRKRSHVNKMIARRLIKEYDLKVDD